MQLLNMGNLNEDLDLLGPASEFSLLTVFYGFFFVKSLKHQTSRALVYSYRARYNGLLASLFLSSREILFNETPLLNSTFVCDFLALVKSGLNGFSLRVFSS